ncbi:hypothetical protein D3C72_1874730 [compost metagenome]
MPHDQTDQQRLRQPLSTWQRPDRVEHLLILYLVLLTQLKDRNTDTLVEGKSLAGVDETSIRRPRIGMQCP